MKRMMKKAKLSFQGISKKKDPSLRPIKSFRGKELNHHKTQRWCYSISTIVWEVCTSFPNGKTANETDMQLAHVWGRMARCLWFGTSLSTPPRVATVRFTSRRCSHQGVVRFTVVRLAAAGGAFLRLALRVLRGAGGWKTMGEHV